MQHQHQQTTQTMSTDEHKCCMRACAAMLAETRARLASFESSFAQRADATLALIKAQQREIERRSTLRNINAKNRENRGRNM
jgi:hypothetical protein